MNPTATRRKQREPAIAAGGRNASTASRGHGDDASRHRASSTQNPGQLAGAHASQQAASGGWSSPSPTRSSAKWTPPPPAPAWPRGAYAAQAVLARARGEGIPASAPLREALAELIRSAGLVRSVGVNLNQAVAKLNATGQPSGDLLPYAAESTRRARRLDAAAEELRRRLP